MAMWEPSVRSPASPGIEADRADSSAILRRSAISDSVSGVLADAGRAPWLPSDHINDSENDDPNGVDEVPIPGEEQHTAQLRLNREAEESHDQRQ